MKMRLSTVKALIATGFHQTGEAYKLPGGLVEALVSRKCEDTGPPYGDVPPIWRNYRRFSVVIGSVRFHTPVRKR